MLVCIVCTVLIRSREVRRIILLLGTDEKEKKYNKSSLLHNRSRYQTTTADYLWYQVN